MERKNKENKKLNLSCQILKIILMNIVLCVYQTSTPFGLALKFQNYTLKEKGFEPCDHGWWKINEKM